MRMLLPVVLLALGCSRQPVAPVEPGQGDRRVPVGIDLGLDGLSLPPDAPSSWADADPWAPDLRMDSPFVDLEYHRSVALPQASPGFTDSKLAKLALIYTDWGYGKEAVHCEAGLKPYQLADLLFAADKVDWQAVNGKLEVCDPEGPASEHMLWLLLTPKEGQPIGVKTTWCSDNPAYPPADVQVFLQVMAQVESAVCGF